MFLLAQHQRSSTPALSSCPSTSQAASRAPFLVTAYKKVIKKQQIVLTKDVQGIGKAGQIKAVPVGYFRNYLQVQGLASKVTEGLLKCVCFV